MSLKYAIQLGAVLICMSACSPQMTTATDSSGGSNNGSSPDAAAAHMDASFVADAAPAMDAAVHMDTGPADSGPAMDAGVSSDAGVFVQTSPVAMNWVYSGPASLYFNQTEVTVAQYEACVTAGSCTSSNHGTSSSDCNYGDASRNDHPMNCVNWHGATEFCAWVGARLPDENEWYAEASNGGTRLYPWGDTPLASCTHCVMDDPSAGGNGCGNESTMPVGSKPLGDSVSGVSDLSGNAWEWTTTPSGSARVVRGGSWINVNQSYLQTSARSSDYPDDRHVSGVGFRCVSVSAP